MILLNMSKNEPSSTETKTQSPFKNFLRNLRSSIGPRQPAILSAVGDNKDQYTTTPSKRRSGTHIRHRKTGISLQREYNPTKRSASRTSASERPSTPPNHRSRSRETSSSRAYITQSPQSSRSSASSRLAFARSQSRPNHQRVVKLSDGHHRRRDSTTYVQEVRIREISPKPQEVSRGRKNEQSSTPRRTIKQTVERTPSPPDLARTPSGTPCSQASDEPITPVLNRHDIQIDLQVDTKSSISAAGTLSSLPEIEEDAGKVVASDADIFDCPEDFYRLPLPGYYGAKSAIPNQRDLYRNYELVTKHRNVATKTTLPDGSQLHNVNTRKPYLARPISTMSTVPILDQTSPVFQPANQSWHAAKHIDTTPTASAQVAETSKSSYKTPQEACPIGESAPIPDMIEVNKAPSRLFAGGPDTLPRKPVSYERLRPVPANHQDTLPSLPEPMLLHRRTNSDGPAATRPPHSQRRSVTMYSYIPTHDTRADRRSYNTVRFLDSRGENHERLRQVLGI